MDTVLFPQWNLFLASILVSGKIVLKLAINFNEKNISAPSCVVTNQQLLGSRETTQTFQWHKFAASFYKAAKRHWLGKLRTSSLRCAEKPLNSLKAYLKPFKNMSKKVLEKFKRMKTIKDLVPLHLMTHLMMNDLCCWWFLSINRTSRAREEKLQNTCI